VASASPEASPAESPAESAAASGSATDEPIEEPAVLNCTAPGEIRPDDLSFDAAPTDRTAASITFATNCGEIVVALDPAAPATVSSAIFLAEEGFYDGTACHRLTTEGIYVLQCGDPAGNGTGGPGYTVPDENLPADGENNYPAGTVAMANAGPGTSGSQFFIVYEDTTLPGDYTIWGTVTSGLDMVQEVASVGTEDGGPDGAPRQPIVIESATVQAS
jgi:peptidyl-prolyl cis-trans isomerase B (cyclophilin B)